MLFTRAPPHQVMSRVSCALKRRKSRSPVYPSPTVRLDTESPLTVETVTCRPGTTTGIMTVAVVPVVETPTAAEVVTEEATTDRRLPPPPPKTRL